jgi:hypothetical protein
MEKIKEKLRVDLEEEEQQGSEDHRDGHETIRESRLYFFAFLETGRDNFSIPFLKNLVGGLD